MFFCPENIIYFLRLLQITQVHIQLDIIMEENTMNPGPEVINFFHGASWARNLSCS